MRLIILGLLLSISTTIVQAQLIKPCGELVDKFTGKKTTWFSSPILLGMLGGGDEGADTTWGVVIQSQYVLSEDFSTAAGDSCILLHKSGKRSVLFADKASIKSVTAGLLLNYKVNKKHLKEIKADPPTDIRYFTKPYPLTITLRPVDQRKLSQAISCYLKE